MGICSHGNKGHSYSHAGCFPFLLIPVPNFVINSHSYGISTGFPFSLGILFPRSFLTGCNDVFDAVRGGAEDDKAGSCQSDGLLSLDATNDDSFLSSLTAALYDRGTANCPWHIQAAPGQHVELYVLDFSLSARYVAVWDDDTQRKDPQGEV